MFVRFSLVLIVVLTMVFLALPTGTEAQSDDLQPTWVDSMDSADSGILSEASPDESLYTYAYDQGQYSMQAHATDFSGDLYSYLSIGQPVDTRTSIDFAIENDQPGKYVFVGCRAGETDNGYAFEVHPSSGEVKLWILTETETRILAEGNASDQLVPGFDFNTIEIECWQNLISGAINGEVVLADFDDTFVSGYSYIGMGVLSDAPSQMSAVFDNLSVIDFNASAVAPAESTVAGVSTQAQPGLDGALSFAEQNPPTAGPLSASADVFDGDLKSLRAEVNVGTFYAEFDFITPANVPPGIWTAGFCFWIDANGNCLEAIIGFNGTNARWALGDVVGSGGYELLDSGDTTGLDMTPGAMNTLGLYVDGQTGILTFNSGSPGATFALPRTASGDIAVQLSYSADADNEPGSFLMETFGFSVWELGAAAVSVNPTTAPQPTTQAQPTAIPTVATSADSSLFEQLRSQAQSQAAVAGPLSMPLVQSASTLPWAPAGANLTDLYATATFVNPSDVSQPWDIGLAIRYTGDNTDARVIVASTGVWNVTIGSGQPIASGQLTSFATGPGAVNTLEVAASGSIGVFALNGLVIAEIDLTASAGPGDVFASSGFFPANVIEGRVVTVQDMSVWGISQTSIAPTATVAAALATTAPAADPAALFQQQKSSAVLNAPLIAPMQGAIVQQPGVLSQTAAAVNVADLYASVTFLNPADMSVSWDFGLSIRGTGNNDDLLFFVNSNGVWNVAIGNEAPTLTGQLTNLNTAAGGANTIEITAQGSSGVAAVNGVVVTLLDLTTVPQSGDVFAASGFFNEYIVPDRQISFVTFQVWPISTGAVPTVTSEGAGSGADPAALFAEYRTVAQTQAPTARPFSGSLIQSNTNFPSALAGVDLADFYVTATFLNPVDISSPWNLGIGLRYSTQNAEIRFIVESNGNWWFATGGAQAVAGGSLTTFNAASGGTNVIEAVVLGNAAHIALNGQIVTTFDLSANAASGDTFISSGFLNYGIVEGRQVLYQDFAVWAIDPAP